jgi:hypothetical protein
MTRIAGAAVVVIALVLGCGKEEPTRPREITLAELVGTWTATKIEFTNKANSNQKIDAIQLGWKYTLTINANGEYAESLSFVSGARTTTGPVTIQGNNTILPSVFSADFGDDMSFAVTLSGNALTLTGDSAFDFDNNETDEPAKVVIVLQKS